MSTHTDPCDCGPDEDYYLECGCTVAWNHGAWDWDLTCTDECSELHTRDEAIALASDER